VNVNEFADNGSCSVVAPATFALTAASVNTDSSYDDGNAEVADLFILHVTLIVVSVDVTEVINGGRMGVVGFPDGNFV
jgi:hypothetical protein